MNTMVRRSQLQSPAWVLVALALLLPASTEVMAAGTRRAGHAEAIRAALTSLPDSLLPAIATSRDSVRTCGRINGGPKVFAGAGSVVGLPSVGCGSLPISHSRVSPKAPSIRLRSGRSPPAVSILAL